MRNRTLAALSLLLIGSGCLGRTAITYRPAQRAPSAETRPRLIVQITVDQLRADYLPHFRGRFGPDGFARFTDRGVYFPVASYAHAVTETAVGHATLFTGALPSSHGVVSNEWFDVGLGRVRYAVEDPAVQTLTRAGKREGGASPWALRATTIGDEIKLAFAARSKVFSFSTKDRGAVLPGGHAGKAFWFDDESGEVVTSSYYGDSLPSWVTDISAQYARDKLAGLRWELSQPRDRYLCAVPDARDVEMPPAGMRDTFPHILAEVPDDQRTRAFRRTPFADELTLALALGALENESLGSDDAPDLLAVSFSATDYVAHSFGPESLELEDQLVRVDGVLARLFAAVLSRVPEERVVFVLSADHGGSETPGHLGAIGLAGQRHDTAALVDQLNSRLEVAFGPGAPYVRAFVNPTIWLDEPSISLRGVFPSDVATKARDIVRTMPGFMRAYTREEIADGSLGRDPIADMVVASFDLQRTGNVYLIPEAGWLLATESSGLASMHGTPHRYDTDVPLAFYGGGLRAQTSLRVVDPRDIAPTLAALLAIKAPSAASGEVLPEVVGPDARAPSADGR